MADDSLVDDDSDDDWYNEMVAHSAKASTCTCETEDVVEDSPPREHDEAAWCESMVAFSELTSAVRAEEDPVWSRVTALFGSVRSATGDEASIPLREMTAPDDLDATTRWLERQTPHSCRALALVRRAGWRCFVTFESGRRSTFVAIAVEAEVVARAFSVAADSRAVGAALAEALRVCGARGPVTVCFDPLFSLDVEAALCAELGLRRRGCHGLVEVWTPQEQQPPASAPLPARADGFEAVRIEPPPGEVCCGAKRAADSEVCCVVSASVRSGAITEIRASDHICAGSDTRAAAVVALSAAQVAATRASEGQQAQRARFAALLLEPDGEDSLASGLVDTTRGDAAFVANVLRDAGFAPRFQELVLGLDCHDEDRWHSARPPGSEAVGGRV